MKKILFAVKNMNVGGVEKSLLSLLNTLDRRKYEVDLLLLEEYGGFMDAIPDWVNVIICKDYSAIRDEVNSPPMQVITEHLKHGRFARAGRLLPAYLMTKATKNYSHYYRAVFHTVKKLPKHYDIAVSYTSIINYLTWLVDYHVNADQYIGWIHFDVSKIQPDQKMLLDLHKKMNKIYVVSQSALDAFVKMFPGLKEKCELRYNVVDHKQILALAEEPAEVIRQSGVKTIVTLGRLSREKGQDIVPEIAAQLINAGLSFKWYLIGDGSLRKQIEEQSNALGVTDSVILLGTKTNPYPYLKQADLYVQPSVYEGCCTTLDEAKLFDLPIISTEVSGAHEQLDGRENCKIVVRSTDALVAAIKEILCSSRKSEEDYNVTAMPTSD